MRLNWTLNINFDYLSFIYVCIKINMSISALPVAPSIQSLSNQNTGNQVLQRMYMCNECPYSTRYKSHMQQHQVKHTGVRPYGCSVCSKGFSQKSNLRLHQRRFHPDLFNNSMQLYSST